MIWPFRRRTTPQPSEAAKQSVARSCEQLERARRLADESQKVGQALRRAHEENHFAAALAAAIAGRNA